MKEKGWIIAKKRRDGRLPSFAKGVSDCYDEEAVYVYPVEEDAVKHLETFEHDTDGKYEVFEVEVVVKKVMRRKSRTL